MMKKMMKCLVLGGLLGIATVTASSGQFDVGSRVKVKQSDGSSRHARILGTGVMFKVQYLERNGDKAQKVITSITGDKSMMDDWQYVLKSRIFVTTPKRVANRKNSEAAAEMASGKKEAAEDGTQCGECAGKGLQRGGLSDAMCGICKGSGKVTSTCDQSITTCVQASPQYNLQQIKKNPELFLEGGIWIYKRSPKRAWEWLGMQVVRKCRTKSGSYEVKLVRYCKVIEQKHDMIQTLPVYMPNSKDFRTFTKAKLIKMISAYERATMPTGGDWKRVSADLARRNLYINLN